MDKWKTDYAWRPSRARSSSAETAWTAAGGTGTPTFVITGPNGTKTFDGAAGISQFEEAIAEVS